MKKILLFSIGILSGVSAFAQIPQRLSYQAVIRNSSQALVVNKQVTMRVYILQGSSTGTPVYIETHAPTTNLNGLISIEIGGGAVVSGNFSSIDWANGPYFVQTYTDPNGGTTYSINVTSQLLSVPYAFHARTAESLSNSNNFIHYIGEEYGGGIIFHLFKDDKGIEHGLIVDKSDLSTFCEWTNSPNDMIGVTAQSWDGLTNSNAIVRQTGHTFSAALLCLNSTNGGYNDWYLPSIQELNILGSNYYTVARSLSRISGATQMKIGLEEEKYYYWSSTEASSYPSTALYFSFNGGSIRRYASKSEFWYVRAVRAF